MTDFSLVRLKNFALSLLQLVIRAQDVDNLVLIELLHAVAGGTEVLARVELGRFFGEGLANGASAHHHIY